MLCIALLLLLAQPIGITEKMSKRWAPSQVRVSVRYIPVGSEEVRGLATAAAAQHSVQPAAVQPSTLFSGQLCRRASCPAGSCAAEHCVQLAAVQYKGE
jgi:hypothetical protein